MDSEWRGYTQKKQGQAFFILNQRLQRLRTINFPAWPIYLQELHLNSKVWALRSGFRVKYLKEKFSPQRPNLKNFNRGSNTRLVILFRVSRFEPALNRNRFLAVHRRELNSLISASGYFTYIMGPLHTTPVISLKRAF